jgi:hypothetical protein
VFYAIKNAIIAARKQNLGDDSYFEMRMPATSERIRMYACDNISARAVKVVMGDVEEMKPYQPQGSF